MAKEIQGELSAGSRKFAIVVSRFNDVITSRLLAGAVDTLHRHGCTDSQLTIVRVPGSMEVPLAAQRLAQGNAHHAVICLSCVIRGQTPHFEYVSSGVARGVADVSLATGVPVIFGVITSDTLEQALDRAGGKSGNKGADAALAAIEMASLMERLDGPRAKPRKA